MTRAVMWRGVRTVQLPLFAPDGIPTAAEWAGDYRARRRTEWAEIIAGMAPGDTLEVIVRDHLIDGEKQEVAAWHVDTLIRLGMRCDDMDTIGTVPEPIAGHCLANIRFTFSKPDRSNP